MVGPISHLAHAASVGNLEVCKLLLDHGAHPHGCGGLWEAASAGNIAIAELLIDRGVDVNETISHKIQENLRPFKDHGRLKQLERFMKESQQGTPLHAAAFHDKADMIEFLLSRGANKDVQNDEGETASDIVDLMGCGPPEPEDIQMPLERRYEILDILK